MKKMIIAALAASTFAVPALANTDTTTIWATISPVCSIDGPADNGSINLTGSTNLGNVTVTCNDPQGFTASVSSGNNGKLADSSGGLSPTTYNYSLNFGPGGTHALTAPITVNSATYGAAAAAAAVNGIALPVSMNITSQNGASFAGTYSDVITWTINAN